MNRTLRKSRDENWRELESYNGSSCSSFAILETQRTNPCPKGWDEAGKYGFCYRITGMGGLMHYRGIEQINVQQGGFNYAAIVERSLLPTLHRRLRFAHALNPENHPGHPLETTKSCGFANNTLFDDVAAFTALIGVITRRNVG